MHAGKLDKRVELYTKVSSSMDLHGQSFPVYSTQSIWVNVKTDGGLERISDGVGVIPTMVTFTIRNRKDISETSVIGYKSANYDVRYIEDLYGRGQWLKVTAERTK